MKKAVVIFLAMTFLFLCGCTDVPERNTVQVSNDGSLVEVLVEDAEGDIDTDSVKEALQSKISDYYISSKGDNVKLKEVTIRKGKLLKEISYGKYDVYNSFNDRTLYAGSIHNALEVEDNTFFYDVNFLNTKSNKPVKAVDVIENTGDKVVIFNDDYIYQVENRIYYISDNVELLDKKSARLKEGESGTGYIIYK